MESLDALLLAAGADPTLVDYEGNSPEDYAFEQVSTFTVIFFWVLASVMNLRGFHSSFKSNVLPPILLLHKP